MKVRQSINLRVFRVRAHHERCIDGCAFRTVEELVRDAANRLSDAAREAIVARGRFTIGLSSCALSARLHRTLAGFVLPDWAHWELFYGDEWAVPLDDPRSHHGRVHEALLSKVPIPTEGIHPMYREGEDLDTLARAYERCLVDRLGAAPTLDALVLGVEPDGQTLALHPGCRAVRERRRNVVSLHDPSEEPPVPRLTFTPPMVHRARLVLVLAAGVECSDAVYEMLEGDFDPSTTPAQIVRDCEGQVVVLLDDDAFDGVPAA